MNKLGDVTRGDVIGKRSKEWFVWTACPNCGLERRVRRGKTELQTYTGWCQTCSARRNNKMRAYHISDNSLAWKGGRTIDHGYVLILLQPDDFFFPMAKHDRYVREHRLVMAKHLNRCLLPWEVVHHKGIKYALGSIENKQDNRIENLELLSSSSKHNKEVERLIKEAREAGYSECDAKWLPIINKIREESRQEGRKEVVGWIEKENPFSFIYRSSVKYQTKLKDWGIE